MELKWHDVNKELPKPGEEYLVLIKHKFRDHQFDEYKLLYYTDDLSRVNSYFLRDKKGISGWYYCDEDCDNFFDYESNCWQHIAYWMELPEKPEVS